jgi:nucleoside 2-deoxyribosyltransferase
MKLYIAGGSSERLTIVRPYVDRAIAAGLTITHDWTRCEGYDRASTYQERRAWAEDDLGGVRRADVVWIIVQAERSEGAGVELGAALILGRRVVVSGPRAEEMGRIFDLLAAEAWPTHKAAFESVAARARKEGERL